MMNIPFSPPDITEEEINEVVDTLRSGWITTGPKTKRFEEEIAGFCHTKRAACLNSATASLELSLRVLGIGPGDEVITTAYTYTASCSVICHVGATPVLVDTIPGSYDMDPEKVRKAVTDRTKAVICVDLAESFIHIMIRYIRSQKKTRGFLNPLVLSRRLWAGLLCWQTEPMPSEPDRKERCAEKSQILPVFPSTR